MCFCFPQTKINPSVKPASPVIKASFCGPHLEGWRGKKSDVSRCLMHMAQGRGEQGQGSRLLLRPRDLTTFHEAKTNRLCVDLFWSHSCKQRIYEDVWCLAPRRFVHQAAAPPTVCPSLPIPVEPGMSSSSDPLGLFPTYKFSFLLSLTRESLNICVIVFGIHWPQCSIILQPGCLFLVFSFIDFYFWLARHWLIHYSGKIWLWDHSLISCQQEPEQVGPLWAFFSKNHNPSEQVV